ncbi:MAG: aminodeoxychorismate synthase component I [Parvibaculaceae bacterium]
MSDTPFVLIDDHLGGRSLLFENPREIVVCGDPSAWREALGRIERGISAGLHAAGFLSYELGYALEPVLAPLMPEERQAPLLWFGLFDAPRSLQAEEMKQWLGSGAYRLDGLRTSIGEDRYAHDFRRVLAYIAAGDIYQANYTLRYTFDFEGDPLALYAELRRRQRVAHGGYIRTGTHDILSLSPELFFRKQGQRITGKPMKGTAPRAPTLGEDRGIAAELARDEKSRAENLMIVDLIRNDFARLAETGSVKVPELFAVETYRTLHQMTSTVEARLKPGTSILDLVRALFPCGSITGAPKIRAMQIIRELEAGPRDVYTGSIGYFAPDGSAHFNVAIRTITLRDGKGIMGIGSGLVADSDLQSEWRECLLKGDFLTRRQEPFLLFETMRWEPEDGYVLLGEHLDRLRQSADYFLYPYPAAEIEAVLRRAAEGFPRVPQRVRLTLSEHGEAAATHAALPTAGNAAPWRFVLSEHRTSPGDPYLFHKTTRRELYDAEFAHATGEGRADEVVFLNTRDELTEGSRTNLFLEIDGRLLTPPLSSGLLPGTLRRSLIKNGAVEERILRREDLGRAERIFLGNSVRGLVEAELQEA